MQIEDNIKEQRDIRFKDYDMLIEAVKEMDDIDPEETIIMLSKDGKLFELNLIGSLVWEQIRNDKNLEELSTALSDIFEVSKEQADKDIESFVSCLTDQGFIRI